MKKTKILLMFIFVLIFLSPVVTSANMAAPKESDIGSVITFEKNDEISVISEVLNITVTGPKANIEAIYTMKNTTNDNVATKSMFLSPNIDSGGVKVLINDVNTSYEVKSYSLTYDTKIETDGWEYVVIPHEEELSPYDQTIDTISFEMSFMPLEKYDVQVSYTYELGGRPTLKTSPKHGIIEYFLVPAAMWKDFSSLTINLYLDKDMPIIKKSNLDFEKIKKRVYQYKSDALPEENLRVVIDQNSWQKFFSTFRSPYFYFGLLLLSPFIIGGIAIIILIIWLIKRKKRKKINTIY